MGGPLRSLAIALSLYFPLASCAGNDDATLVIPGTVPFGIALPDIPVGKEIVITDTPVCVARDDRTRTEASAVRLVRAWPTAGSGVKVSDLGIYQETVAGDGIQMPDIPPFTPLKEIAHFRSKSVTVQCSKDRASFGDAQVSFIGIEVSRIAEEGGFANGITVEYVSGGNLKQMSVPIILWLCPNDVETNGGCRKP